MMRSSARSQDGGAMIMAIAFISLVVPLVLGGLTVASSLAIDSRVRNDVMEGQYTVIGGSEHALYRLIYEEGYSDSLIVGTVNSYTITLNGQDVSVGVAKVTDTQSSPSPPPSDSSQVFATTKEVTPASAPPDTPTSFLYTINVVNSDAQAKSLRKIHDGLPSGMSYVTGTTDGITTNDPSITLLQSETGGSSYFQLTWNVAPLGISLGQWETATLTFVAEGSFSAGNYCNVMWVEPGGMKTSTGPTARIVVGTPSETRCPGEAVQVTVTVTPDVVPANTLTGYAYDVTIENTGTVTLNVSRVRDLLPEGFSFAAGSAEGMTALDPATTMFQGRQRLDWDFSPSKVVVPGEVTSLKFVATAQVGAGEYWNEVWVAIDELDDSVYSWPVARVEAMGVVSTTANSGQSESAVEVWVGTNSHVISEWDISR